MKTKPKTLHPNKLVQQHDEYLIDKSLVNRVKSAKTTIKNSNNFFENRLKSRNKARNTKNNEFKTEEFPYETNGKPNTCVFGMDENLLNYLNTFKQSNENQENSDKRAQTFNNSKKKGFSAVNFEYLSKQSSGIPNFKNEVGFPTEKNRKNQDFYETEKKNNFIEFNMEKQDYFNENSDNYPKKISPDKKENERYKKTEEIEAKILDKKQNIDEDVSHCNFDSPEIIITSKGLLRNSTYKTSKNMAKTNYNGDLQQ